MIIAAIILNFFFGWGSHKMPVHENEPNKPLVAEGYFASPIGQEARLSATFGELRANHFHAGLDIRSSNGRSGDPIYAAAEGYISRISIKSGGYGQAIFIAHPNGYTTVYAHLDEFAPTIANFVESNQYAQEAFEVEIYPSPTDFVVKKGEEIGKMGNTGHSFGAHLHFEIRETKTDNPMNPMLFGIPIVKDDVAPFFSELKVYQFRGMDAVKKGYLQPYKSFETTYRIAGDTILVNEEKIGLAVKAFDKTSPSANKDGLYALNVYAGPDSTHLFGFEMQQFSFNETQCINAHCDYEDILNRDGFFNRCFRLPNNPLPFYSPSKTDGYIRVPKDSCVNITLVAKDYSGNQSFLKFVAKYVPDTLSNHTKTTSNSKIFNSNKENIIENEEIKVKFKDCTFYEDIPFSYFQQTDSSYNVYSNVHHIHDSKIPLNKSFDIAIKGKNIKPEKKEKYFIANCSRNRVVNCGGKWDGDFLKSEVKSLGDYCIMSDDVPPTIKSVNFKKNMRKASTIKFRIGDNFATDSNVKNISYKGYVDNKWVLMKYDSKSAIVTYEIDENKIGKGEHTFKLIVVDAMGNESIFENPFNN